MTAKKTHEPKFVLAGRSAMVGVDAAYAEKSKRRKAQRGSADHQRHHSCAASGLPLAGLSAGLRSRQEHIQSFPPLGEDCNPYLGAHAEAETLVRKHSARGHDRLRGLWDFSAVRAAYGAEIEATINSCSALNQSAQSHPWVAPRASKSS